MKSLKQITLAFAATLLLLTSCDNDVSNPANEFSANDKFTYATTKTVQLVVDVNDTYSGEYFYKVEVFDRNPLSTDTVAKLLTAGIAKENMNLATSLVIPQNLSQIYICQTDPLQRRTIKVISTDDAENLTCDFKISANQSASQMLAKVVSTDPKATDYPLPTSYTTLSSSAVTLGGSKYYLPAGVSNSNISYGWKNSSELYVAGEAIFNSIYMPPYSKLIILPGGSITFNVTANIEQNVNVIAIYEGGTLTFNQASSIGSNSLMVNDGTLNINNGFEIRSNSEVVNNGTLNATSFTLTNNTTLINNLDVNITNSYTMNSNTTLRNDGIFEVGNTIVTNNNTSVITNNNTVKTKYLNMRSGGGVINNYCKVICTDLDMEGVTINSAPGTIISCHNVYANNTYINLTGDAIFKTGADVEDNTYSIAEGVQFNFGVKIDGQVEDGSYPLVDVWTLNNKASGWKVLDLTGTMEFSLPATETPNSHFYKKVDSSVSFVEMPTVTIAGTDCNGGGVNANPGSGSPTDPEFPMVVSEDNEYTFALEDLWPNLGDYDMNDFVFSITNIKKTINSENKVQSMSFDITPKANGSTKNIAAALQFDNIAAGQISLSSTGSIGNIEDGQTSANVILFPQVCTLFGKSSPTITNTYSQIAKIETQTYTFTIDFATPANSEDVIISNMNFYVIVGDVNSTDRNEVHLAGFSPSSKVQKATNNYKDSNNMVWAIMLPVSDFAYPTENTKIYSAYPKFSTWAESAGTVDTDWYLYPSENTSLVYSK
ncbi:MAG: LruC domain-containing protein [Paludibacter sp.]|nr:LruC domain-containing protein [Paludibacter sp.]